MRFVEGVFYFIFKLRSTIRRLGVWRRFIPQAISQETESVMEIEIWQRQQLKLKNTILEKEK